MQASYKRVAVGPLATIAMAVAVWLLDREGFVIPAPLDAVIPLGPIETEIAWEGPASVELVTPGAAGQVLAAERKGGRLRFTLPRLDAYAQIVIRA